MIKQLIFFLFFVSILVAQEKGTIQGSVSDSKTGQKLVDVNIIIKNTQKGVSTDLKGNFKLLGINEGKHTLEISYMGYHTTQKYFFIKDGEIKTIDVFLKEQTESLSEITIVAKNKVRKLREQAMPVSVISMKQLQGTVANVTDVLSKTVGVTLRSSGGVGSLSRISLRGLEGKRIGFFIDETPMDHSDFIDINDIPVDMIDRIEIYKGVVPAKFGGSSMGGAVNLVIKEYPERYADVSYTRESFNVNKVQTVIKRNLKHKGLLFGVGGTYTYADNDYTMELPYIKGFKIKRNHNKFKKLMVVSNIEATKWWFDKVELEPVFISTYREIQGIESNIREANMSSSAYILANALEKDDFFIAGLDFDMSTSVAYTQYSLTDKAKQWFDWQGNAYPSQSFYGGELGNRYASESDNKKITVLHKLNLEYLFNESNSINFNSLFTLANAYPKDELKNLSYGRKMVFDSKMKSWVTGFTYDFKTTNNKLLNSFTTRYYLYTTHTHTHTEQEILI